MSLAAAAIVLLATRPAPAAGPEGGGIEGDEVDADVQDIVDEDLQEPDEGKGGDGGGKVKPAAKAIQVQKPPGFGTSGPVDWDATFGAEVGSPASTFTSSRRDEDPFHSGAAVSLVTESDVEEAQASEQSAALLDVPGLFPLMPAAAGPSPVIRGLLGQRVALLFDGIRLDHATTPPGPSVLAGLADPLSLAALEIVRGPSLVMVGPMAAGGTINFIPALPYTSPLVSFRTDASASYGYGSADSSHVLHGEVDLQIHEAAAAAALTFGTFGALQDADGKQPYTEYSKLAFDLGVRQGIDLGSDILFYWGTTRLGQAYMPLTDPGDAGRDFMRWSQLDRNLLFLRYGASDKGPFEAIQLTAGLHLWDERPQHYYETTAVVPTLSTWDRQSLHTTQAFVLFWNRASLGGWGNILTGLDYYLDLVDARGTILEFQGADPPVSSPHPRTWLPDGALSHALEPHALLEVYALRPFMLSVGGRLWYRDLEPSGGLNQRHLVGGSGALSGRLAVADLVAFILRVSYGTRPPTMGEYAGEGCAPLAQVGSPGLDPEGTLGAEAGVKWSLGILEGSLFYGFTLLDDMILPVALDPQPADRCAASGQVVRWENAGTGFVHSLELENRVVIREAWAIGTVLSWYHGTLKLDGSTGSGPMALVPPLMGTVFLSVRYPRQYLWGDVRLRFAIRQNRLAADEIVAPGEADPFFLLSIRGGVDLGDHLRLFVSFENLVGKSYLYHGSSINGPGRSVHLGIEGHL